MRTIKFRGKRVDNCGEWVYGYLIEDLLTDYQAIVSFEYWRAHIYRNEYSILKSTVGQFTGLYDKNGNEIYEGDIVRVNQFNMEMSFHKVEYDIEHKYPAFDLNPIFKFADSNSLQYALIVYEVEVVGNIHDNKDLLE